MVAAFALRQPRSSALAVASCVGVKSRPRGHNANLEQVFRKRWQTPANFPVRRPFQSHWAFVVNSGKLAYR